MLVGVPLRVQTPTGSPMARRLLRQAMRTAAPVRRRKQPKGAVVAMTAKEGAMVTNTRESLGGPMNPAAQETGNLPVPQTVATRLPEKPLCVV